MLDIKRLNDLHAATTQGEWKARQFEGMTGGATVEPEMTLDDWRSCCELHSAWPDVAARLATLEEFAREVAGALDDNDLSRIYNRVLDASFCLDAETKKAGE
jgi:hypothetical protein